jgi:hypothetical protein
MENFIRHLLCKIDTKDEAIARTDLKIHRAYETLAELRASLTDALNNHGAAEVRNKQFELERQELSDSAQYERTQFVNKCGELESAKEKFVTELEEVELRYSQALERCELLEVQNGNLVKDMDATGKNELPVRDRHSELEFEERNLTKELEAVRHQLSQVSAKCTLAENDNIRLRDQIASTAGNAQDILRAEEHYTSELRHVACTIEDWIAKEIKSNRKADAENPMKLTGILADDVKDQVVSKIASLGTHGRASAAVLGRSLSEFYKTGESRIALIRHIVSLYLFHKVLDTFAFGFQSPMSEVFNRLEKRVYSQGTPSELKYLTFQDFGMEQILTIRQAVGQAALFEAQQNAEPTRHAVTVELATMLCELLPLSKDQRIQEFASKVVKKTIGVRNAMTEEKGIYRCFLIDCGDTFDQRVAKVSELEVPVGNVLLCMFPGVQRLSVAEQNRKEFVAVTRASVKLEGAFIKRLEK